MGKVFNQLTGQFEDDGNSSDLDQLFDSVIAPKQEKFSMIPQEDQAASVEMNPVVKDYLLSKAAKEVPKEDISIPAAPMPQASKGPSLLEQFSPEKYKEALQSMKDKQANLGLAQLAAGIGDALARRDSSSSDRYFQDLKGNIQDQTVGEFNRQKASAIADVKTKQQLEALDPNSPESVRFRKLVESTMPNIVKTYGKNWGMVSASDASNILDYGKMRETIDARKAQYQMQHAQRSDQIAEKKKLLMNEIEDRRQNINATLNQLDSMIKEDGTWEAFGSHNQDLDRKVDEIATDMAKLMDPNSVARPNEVEMVKRNLIQSGFKNSNSTARDILKNFKGEVNRRADAAYKIRGLQMPGGDHTARQAVDQSQEKPSWAK